MQKADQPDGFGLLKWVFNEMYLFTLADNVKYPCCPRLIYNRLKFTIRGLVVRNYFARSFIASELLVFDWTVANGRTVVFIDADN